MTVRDTTTQVKKFGPHSLLEVCMKGVRAPCMKIDAKYEDRVVKLIENWNDVDGCGHPGKITRNSVICPVDQTTKKTPLSKGEVIEIEGHEAVFVVHPLSSLEKRYMK